MVAAVTGTAVLGAGCGSSSTTPSTAASGTSSAGVTEAKATVAKLSQPTTSFKAPGPAINTSSLHGKSVWYIPISLQAPAFAIGNDALKTALGKVGITEHVCSAEANPSTTASCVNQAVSQGASAIVTDAVPVALAANAFASAQAHHLPILIVNQLPPPASVPGAVKGLGDDKLAYSPLQAGNLVAAEADWVVADSNGNAKVLVMPYTDSPSTLAYSAQEVARLHKLCPSCQVVSQKIGLANASMVPSQTSSALLSHPGIQYVTPEFDALNQGVAQGIQQAGYANKVKLVSSAGDLPALQAIKSGQLSAEVGESFPYEGWANADEVMRMMLGKPIVTEKPPLRLFTAANVAPLALTPAAQASGEWYGSDAYTKMFEKLWGAG
ncbi:MAG: sugar ABC transporter substrate-binding protein [Solirubrobacteraceae bacterium]